MYCLVLTVSSMFTTLVNKHLLIEILLKAVQITVLFAVTFERLVQSKLSLSRPAIHSSVFPHIFNCAFFSKLPTVVTPVTPRVTCRLHHFIAVIHIRS